jgi:hypothetical protein
MYTNTDKEETTLWIGGSSSLARTFFVNQELLFVSPTGRKTHRKIWILTGLEKEAPRWIAEYRTSTHSASCSLEYWSLDLTTLDETDAVDKFSNPNSNENQISSIVVGVRPLLYSAYMNADIGNEMLLGLERLLQVALHHCTNLRFVLHISSVAAANHLRSQCNVTEEDDVTSLPPLSEYDAPYDRFKQQSEDIITRLCSGEQNELSSSRRVRCTHLRLSAIFSDDVGCIQCSALDLQARVGAYLDLPIDCNSSVNVSRAISFLLYKASLLTTTTTKTTKPSQTIQPIYYYTRPLLLPNPVPYGYYLEEYRKGYMIHNASIWIPLWIVTTIVWIVHWLVVTCNNQSYSSWKIPYLDSIDYLLQVASREHSFDCSRFRSLVEDHRNCVNDGIVFVEESILECFIRRRLYLTEVRKKNRMIT